MDNCVLSNTCLPPIGYYDHWHPGGKFTLKKNFGRDISKFFYGGYKLVNTQEEEMRNHSQSALIIANSMIIANLESQSLVRPIKCKVQNVFAVNKIANCFQLAATESQPNWKHFYQTDMIGRHFVVYSKSKVHFKRQYTICNCIVPEVYS